MPAKRVENGRPAIYILAHGIVQHTGCDAGGHHGARQELFGRHGLDTGLGQKVADHPKQGVITTADSARQQLHSGRIRLQLRQRRTTDFADHDNTVAAGIPDQLACPADCAKRHVKRLKSGKICICLACDPDDHNILAKAPCIVSQRSGKRTFPRDHRQPRHVTPRAFARPGKHRSCLRIPGIRIFALPRHSRQRRHGQIQASR